VFSLRADSTNVPSYSIREILVRSENSRTGKGVSSRILKQFDAADSRKDEELEKVRRRRYRGWRRGGEGDRYM